MVYSGIDSGLYADVHPFRVSEEFKNSLIDCEDHSNIEKVSDCEGKSKEYLEYLNILSNRARFLTKMAAIFEHCGVDYGMDYIYNNKSKAESCYGGESNLFLNVEKLNSETNIISFNKLDRVDIQH